MNIVIIASNVGSINDGVGGYAKYLSNALRNMQNIDEVIVESGETDALNKKQMITSNQMSNAIKLAICQIEEKQIDVVIVEYPFKEYNPMIVPLLRTMKNKLHKKNGKMILSLHEYFRAKKVRQIVMRRLAKMADSIFVTEKNIQKYFQKFGKDVYIRDIPSIIPMYWEKTEKKDFSQRRFVYFGLIIANKAFDEMIQAWKVFNANRSFTLEILTSSEVAIDECEQYNISLYKNLDDLEIAKHMKEATYCILPIKPEIGMYNTTFKTATRAGCTIIGKFSEQFKGKEFAVHIDSYEEKEFVAGLEKASKLSENELEKNKESAMEFGERFSFEYTAKQIVEKIV